MAEFDGHIRQVGHITNQLLDEFREKVSQISESSWRASNAKKPNQFDVFKDSVHHLVLQFPMNLEDHRVSGVTRHWRDWRDSMSTVLEAVSGYYQFPRPKTSRIMLARLFPGADIPLHIDGSEAARKPHKIHLPILTSEKVEFLFEDAFGEVFVEVVTQESSRRFYALLDRPTPAMPFVGLILVLVLRVVVLQHLHLFVDADLLREVVW